MAHPFDFQLKLLPHVTNNLAPEFSQFQVRLQRGEPLIAGLQPSLAAANNVFTHLRLEHREQAHAQVESIFRSCFGVTELAEAFEQMAAALR